MTPFRILIADHHPDTGRFLQTCLVRAGYSVPAVAANGNEALERAQSCAPDLILLNATLPGSPNAPETARRLQQDRFIPILFLAPEGMDVSLNRAHVPFGAGYLTGAISESDLLNAVSEALRQGDARPAQERHRRTLDQTLAALEDGVVTTDLAGLITYLNPRAAALLHADPAALLGSPLSPVLQASQPRATISAIPLEQSDGSISGCIHLLRETPAGAEGNPVPDLLESIPDPLLVLDPSFAVIRLNAPAAALLGAPLENLPGTPLLDHLGPSNFETHLEELNRSLADHAPRSFELHLESADTWWQARVFPLAGQLLVLLQDITEQKRAAAESQRVARLEGLSHLARGFTHDFNNLLTILMGNLALARALTGPGELQRLLEEAESATKRARDLVEQLTTFAKGGAPIKGMIPLRPLLGEVLSRRPASSRIEYHPQFDGTEFTLDADPKQLRRLLENLILNAEQAISEKGEIHIRCFREEEDPSPASRGPWLVIEIRDTGCGMSEETRLRAFEPFFTTRAQVNASGLGLTVCESIAKAHGGSLQLSSQPGQGTLAQVRLPIHALEQAAVRSPGLSRSHPLNGRRHAAPGATGILPRILVLEDETLIRRLIHSTLTQAGYQVDETWDGHQTVEAYRLAREKGQPYDLLIMDLAIENGMGGVEAMSRIRSLDPAALAIVSSGYSDDPAMARPREYGFTSVLPKPYQPRHLVEAVEQLLSQRQASPDPQA